MEGDYLLLGFRGGERGADLDRIVARVGEPDYAAALGRAGVRGAAALLAHEVLPLGVLEPTDLPGPLHTLYHPRLSDVAARAFFRGGLAGLPPLLAPKAIEAGARNSLLRQYAARFAAGMPDSVRQIVLHETWKCRPEAALTLLAQWDLQAPGSPHVAAALDRYWNAAVQSGDDDPADLARLESLLNGEAPATAVSLATAERASLLFEKHFHYAAPFRREALARLWGAAPANPRTLAARRRVEARLGPLE
jgi:hypothetical protein